MRIVRRDLGIALYHDTGDPSLKGCRILLVEDNLDGAQSLAMLLRAQGAETVTAHDGPGALREAQQARPDAVLLDIGLPKMNGYEVCRTLRRQPWAEHLPVIAMTVWGQEDDRRKAKEAGFDAHLVKPVEYSKLSAVLATLLAGRCR